MRAITLVELPAIVYVDAGKWGRGLGIGTLLSHGIASQINTSRASIFIE